jgi:hypothetical protein
MIMESSVKRDLGLELIQPPYFTEEELEAQ